MTCVDRVTLSFKSNNSISAIIGMWRIAEPAHPHVTIQFKCLLEVWEYEMALKLDGSLFWIARLIREHLCCVDYPRDPFNQVKSPSTPLFYFYFFLSLFCSSFHCSGHCFPARCSNSGRVHWYMVSFWNFRHGNRCAESNVSLLVRKTQQRFQVRAFFLVMFPRISSVVMRSFIIYDVPAT